MTKEQKKAYEESYKKLKSKKAGKNKKVAKKATKA